MYVVEGLQREQDRGDHRDAVATWGACLRYGRAGTISYARRTAL